MIWIISVFAIIGWAIAIASSTVCGLMVLAYAAKVAEETDNQRPMIHQSLQIKKFGKNDNNGKSVPETGSL